MVTFRCLYRIIYWEFKDNLGGISNEKKSFNINFDYDIEFNIYEL